MYQPLALQPVGGADGMQEVDGALLQHPGTDALLDVGPVAVLQHH